MALCLYFSPCDIPLAPSSEAGHTSASAKKSSPGGPGRLLERPRQTSSISTSRVSSGRRLKEITVGYPAALNAFQEPARTHQTEKM